VDEIGIEHLRGAKKSKRKQNIFKELPIFYILNNDNYHISQP